MMKRLLYLLPVIVIAVVIAVACSTEEEEEKFGEISGIVFDENVGEPISIAQIKLTPGGNSTVTGSDGSFSFIGILPGNYTITVNKKGYEDCNNTVAVVAGKKAECNVKMKRIPAYVTADKEVLEFGENNTLTTLSFNIVNGSYENLSWHIEYDSLFSFIAKVSPDKGITQYGKTSAIVVRINREKLNVGLNESSIVVVSDNGDGSSVVRIKAIGQEKAKPTLNYTGTTKITSSTAVVHGKITFGGIPAYTERGFVYNIEENPTIEVDNNIEKVMTPVTVDSTFSYKLRDLQLGYKYYVRAYAINDEGVSYSNQESFTTVASLPVVSVFLPDNIDTNNKTATLHGKVDSIGDPEYYERGFVYCEGRQTPTIEGGINFKKVSVPGTGIGSFDASISNLKLGIYSVRAYAINNGGYSYSKNTVELLLAGTEPQVSVGEITDISLTDKTAILHGSLMTKGSPTATIKGFVYSSVNKKPTLDDTHVELVQDNGHETGSYFITISRIELGKTYYVRAYAKNEAGTTYSDEVVDFSTVPVAATVKMRSVTSVDRVNLTALFQGAIETIGDPPYIEKGFVFSSTNTTPTINDSSVKVEGSGIGTYETKVSNLIFGKTYYVRAYAINENVITYSDDVVSFDILGTTPIVSVGVVDGINLSSLTANLNGYVSEVGYPAISERGFVYSSNNNTPTINDSKVTVDGDATGGSYSVQIKNLALDKTYYVKAYVSNSLGLFYSENTISFSTEATFPVVSVSSSTNMNLEVLTANVSGRIEDAGNPEYTEKGFVYGYNNKIPTVENDIVINVSGSQTGTFSTTLPDLVLGKNYYLRAFAKNAKGIAYSDTVSFLFDQTLAEIRTGDVTNFDFNTTVAILHGSITDVGNPAYQERGFVLSTLYEQPTINDQKIIVSGSATTGDFEYRLTEFSKTENTYVRAYAINEKGVAYGKPVLLFDATYLDMGDYIILGSKGIAVQKEDIGYGNWYDMNRLCQNSNVGGLSGWRLPTYNELVQLYNMKDMIGNFRNDDYWSSKSTSESYSFKIYNQGKYDYYNEVKYYYYGVDFGDGSQFKSSPYDTYYKSESATGSHYTRAVRSL